MSDFSQTSPNTASGKALDDFHERLIQLIAVLNISQNEFARRIGSTSAFISNLTTGKSKPGLEFLQKIAETFEVSLDWLVLGKGTTYGDQYIDPEWFHTVLLRVVLAEQAAHSDQEALALVAELLGETQVSKNNSPARQQLLNLLAASTEHSLLLSTLYNRYLPMTDATLRSKEVLRAAMQQLLPNSSDPLALLVNQDKSNKPKKSKKQAQQVQIGNGNRAAGRDYNER